MDGTKSISETQKSLKKKKDLKNEGLRRKKLYVKKKNIKLKTNYGWKIMVGG